MVALMQRKSPGSFVPGPPLQPRTKWPSLAGEALTVATSKDAVVGWASRAARARREMAKVFMRRALCIYDGLRRRLPQSEFLPASKMAPAYKRFAQHQRIVAQLLVCGVIVKVPSGHFTPPLFIRIGPVHDARTRRLLIIR